MDLLKAALWCAGFSALPFVVALPPFFATFSLELEDSFDVEGSLKVGASCSLPARRVREEACAMPGIDLHRSNKLGSSEDSTICGR